MSVKEFISSGILELYVLGAAGNEEVLEVERMAAMYPEVKNEIALISKTIEQQAIMGSVTPGRTVKPFLMATIDYMERMEHGDTPQAPPLLNEKSNLKDYATWLNRVDMLPPKNSEDIFAKIIGFSQEATTAIVWIKTDTPAEVHHDEHEKFLIVEGTCDILVEDKIFPLVPGDYFEIPLHKKHVVKVTSAIPCKVILQRIAA